MSENAVCLPGKQNFIGSVERKELPNKTIKPECTKRERLCAGDQLVVEAEIKDFQGVWRWWLMPVIVAT
jgi:hypothetical protein